MNADNNIYAVVGKGGTGKTTTSGLLVKYLLAASRVPILAIDADPSSCLGDVLGLQVQETLGDIREDLLKNPGTIPKGMSKQAYLDYQTQASIIEAEQMDLLTMGRPEGPGCYCFVNSILRNCIDSLSGEYPSVVVDCEAGIEHLSRRTTVNVDYLFLITDVSIKGIKTVQVILEIIEQLKNNAKKKILLFNRVEGEKDEPLIQKLLTHVPKDAFAYIGRLPSDRNIIEYEMHGKSIVELSDDAPVYKSFTDIMQRI